MAQYKTPDVYVREKSTLPPSVAEVPTAIPVFVGYTEKVENAKQQSILLKPTKITNMAEYQTVFGGKAAESFTVNVAEGREPHILSTGDSAVDGAKKMPTFMLAHAIEHFFANGGGACYIVSVGAYMDASGSGMTMPAKADFDAGLKVVEEVDEITLICLVDAHSLTMDNYYNLQNDALAQCSKLQDRFTLMDVIEADTSTLVSAQIAADAASLRAAVTGDLKYGAAYYPNVLTSYPRHYIDTSINVIEIDSSGNEGPATTLDQMESANTATYNAVKKALAKNFLLLPPSPAVAGVIARVDGSRGVWKAPANEALAMVKQPSKMIKSSDQDDLNVDSGSGKSINAIRQFTGKGNLIWGARTLAGNDNEWRYISVRRLFNMVEESVQKATGFAVFEPNTPFTWLKLKTMIESYLENLWKQGALFGESAAQAFFVNVGLGQTMTEDDINNGIMHIEIGLAAVRPAEFIVLTFSHKSLEG